MQEIKKDISQEDLLPFPAKKSMREKVNKLMY